MSRVQNFYKEGNRLYWEAERFVHKASLYVVPVFLMVFIPLFFIQYDYIMHGNKRDLSALPLEKQERLKELQKAELKMYIHEGHLENRLTKYDRKQNTELFKEIKNCSLARSVLIKEISDIIKLAPYNAFSYKFYRAIGAVKEKV